MSRFLLTLPVDGQCTCDVVVNGGASRLLRFYVVSADSEPLLSLNACEELGVIQRLCVTNGVRPHTNAAAGLNGMIEELSSDHVVKDYVDLFQGIGMLKDYPYMIRVKEEAIPRIVATPRRVPFPLLRKVQDELQRMLTEGIVEEVVDPTPWVSPMVPVLKKDGTVRICVDYSELNKSVQREQFQLPKAEELFAKMHGAKFFSTLDAASADSASPRILRLHDVHHAIR